jgi:RNA recognition motif-containing protein
MDEYRGAPRADFRKSSGCLFIGNVPYSIGEPELFEIFDRIGPVSSVVVGKDKRTGNHRGHAFVQYKNQSDAQEAYYKLKGYTVKDRQLRIDFDAGLETKSRVFTRVAPESR